MRKKLILLNTLFGLSLIAMHDIFDFVGDYVADRDINDQLSAFSIKHKLCQEKFDNAIASVSERPEGEYLAEQLRYELNELIGTELSADEWATKVKQAYLKILKNLEPMPAMTMIKTHPIETIALATTWRAY